MPDHATARMAVLIDADNTSAAHAAAILEELARYGTPTVKRAYGDWTTQHLVGWKSELPRHAIQPIQQFANTVGKNSTDSALIIDAMDLLYSGNVEGFVIVSSDSDFTRLATRLREAGMTVYGIGARKTPSAFRDACDKFTFLEVLRDQPVQATAVDEGTAEPVRDQGGLQSLLATALNKTASDDDDWSALGALGSHLNRIDPSFDSRTYGFGKLSALVHEQPYLETRTVESNDGRGQLWVRLKRGATRKRTTKKSSTAKAETAQPSTGR